jgi:hypothetical protein
MKGKELQTLLDRAEISQRRAAKELGINERTMRRYVADDAEIPRAIDLAIVSLLEQAALRIEIPREPVTRTDTSRALVAFKLAHEGRQARAGAQADQEWIAGFVVGFKAAKGLARWKEGKP